LFLPGARVLHLPDIRNKTANVSTRVSNKDAKQNKTR